MKNKDVSFVAELLLDKFGLLLVCLRNMVE